MEFVVCIKQVPSSDKIDINPETGSLVRESTGAKTNPYDLSAIEACLQVREKVGGKIHAISMGPKQAKTALREALALSVDEVFLISDSCFAGSDVLTTSYTLAQAIKTIAKPDIIFCGKQSTDGDTCQVSPELAEFLGIPHALYVVEINDINDEYIVVTCDMGSYRETVKMNFPCLISVEKDSFIPRFSSLRNKIEAQKKPINTIELKDLEDKDKNNYGYCGSPTKVSKIYVPEIKRETTILDGETDEVVDKLFLKLDEWEVL
ncbi:electron transfer flavoprotein subunit beta/FixA family protein [Sporanaerobacter acetigenes]|uniref:Electron transfer flavoprotein small subunit n=1 Tax=Sporanaerobacter acetigenes DSM 13106 TaxID=1123281 RepID=A0A1M5YDX1_9FIRM|nr:electron transfer flavoprotein subunit beta/FixA family protein [Sporanaerobacter acetigenes]SHI09713.1 electron transfer flavoprotein beta subunit [Sporanaerobacter acetigenes DSM 13106]